MRLDDAIEHLAEIRLHLSRTEVCRGVHALPILFTAGTAFLGTLAYPQLSSAGQPATTTFFILYWTTIAMIAGVVVGLDLINSYFRKSTPAGQKAIRQALCQYVPAVFCGGVLALVVLSRFPEMTIMLPGLWAMCHGLGLFACRTYLPRSIGWVALYFVTVGALLLTFTDDLSTAVFTMGMTFGLGQFIMSLVLFWDEERSQRLEADHA